ncbi:MAG: UDP-N-acetylmuramate dehydrogenase, partial [Halieaceae bacterium]
PEPSHRDVMEAVIAIRRERLPDPVTQPNAGSFFKNPEVTSEEATSLAAVYPDLPQFQAGERVKLSAAWLIERAGWRGTSVSGVCMSSQHALVLVNESADTASELLAFASQVQQSVQKQFGVELSIEPDVL